MFLLKPVFINFLSGWAVNWCKWGVKLPYCYCVTVSFSLHVYLFYEFSCFYIVCIYFCNCYFLFLDQSLDRYVMSFFVSCYSLCLKVCFVCYKYCYLTFLLSPFSWVPFPIFSLSVCVPLDMTFFVRSIYCFFLLQLFSHSISFDWRIYPFHI